MKKRINISVFLLFGILLLSACKPEVGQLSQVTKTVVFPGLEHAPMQVHYKANVLLNKPVIVKQLSIKNNQVIDVTDYKLFSLKSHTYIDVSKVIPKGDYRLLIILPETPELSKSEDTLVIQFQLPKSEKVYTISEKVKLTEPEMRP